MAGTAGFGLGAPKAPGGFTLALVLTIAAMFAIGLWVSAIARTTGGASAIGQLLLYPLLFFAGLWLPQERMAPVLRHISDWSPLGASVHALQGSMQGTFPSAQSLLVLAGWAVRLRLPGRALLQMGVAAARLLPSRTRRWTECPQQK